VLLVIVFRSFEHGTKQTLSHQRGWTCDWVRRFPYHEQWTVALPCQYLWLLQITWITLSGSLSIHFLDTATYNLTITRY